ncbi:DUF6090 family protein [Winogradskyella sp. PE311]|uniref:DUF6090 family protein n=1 Tax=Winogradskyella sp. PE311 TaxID=3366943 RepID=UPI0039804A15
MFKFFRKIRKDLIANSKTSKYFKYAIGEVVLVVIGILIALGINSWNQNRLSDKQELNYLSNLKDELINNIDQLKVIDSIYTSIERDNTKGINLLKNYSSIYQFKTIDSLLGTTWMTFQVTNSTYNEMLNNGSFYSLNNKILRSQIDDHYILLKRFESAFLEINRNGQDIRNNKDISSLDLLIDRLREKPINLKGIDTNWIHNVNSKIYTGFYRKAKFYKSSSKTRKRLVNLFTESCNELIEAIDKELK